jgi:hypothetical protein
MARSLRRILRASALAACTLAALPGAGRAAADCGAAGAWPPPFRFAFDAVATRTPLWIAGDSDLVLTRDGDGYLLVAETRAVGFYHARQSSRGAVGAGGLVPLEYTEQRWRRPQATTKFDWSARRVSFSAVPEAGQTQPRMQDRLSLLLELGRTLRLQPAVAFVELPVAGVRHTSTYRFEVRGMETLDLPVGRIDAVKLERPADAPGNDRHDRLEVWLAPALCWLPARVRYDDDRGLTIDQRLKAAQIGS